MIDKFESLRKKAWEYLDARRVPHVAGCEKEAVKLAEFWGENTDDAAVAGMLHDCTKRLSYKEHVRIIKDSGTECSDELLAEKKLLHAVSGSAVAKNDFGASDKVCDAIRWHTTGKPDMTLFEKIIYLADYIEETRTFDGVDKLRALAYKDIDRAMELGLEMSVNNIREQGVEPFKDSLLAYEYYKREE